MSTPELIIPSQRREKSSFAYAHHILKPYGELDPVLAWCKTETEEDWRWEMIRSSSDRDPGEYVFYFDSERDYVAFLLKWA